MAGMRALGRVYDTLAAGSTTNTVTVCLKDCSGIGIDAITGVTGTASLTFTAGGNLAGASTAVTTANGFGQPSTMYVRATGTGSGSAGSVAWVKQTTSWASNVLSAAGTAGNQTHVDYLVSELADTYDYLKIAPSNCFVFVTLYDLTVQRTPENMRIPSA